MGVPGGAHYQMAQRRGSDVLQSDDDSRHDAVRAAQIFDGAAHSCDDAGGQANGNGIADGVLSADVAIDGGG